MATLPDGLDWDIRAATRADLSTLVALRQRVGWSSGGLDAGFATVEAGRQLVLLAESQSRLVGACAVTFHVGGGRGRAHVSDLLVDPDWRRRGIATALLDAAEDAARQRGHVECTLDVDAHNSAALALYLGRGYRHHRPAYFPWGPGYTLKKPLVQRPPAARRPFWRFWARSDGS